MQIVSEVDIPMPPQQEVEEPVPFQPALPTPGAAIATAIETENGILARRNPIELEKTIAQTGTGAIAIWGPRIDPLLQPAMRDRILHESVRPHH